jgi:hypothetical protein
MGVETPPLTDYLSQAIGVVSLILAVCAMKLRKTLE